MENGSKLSEAAMLRMLTGATSLGFLLKKLFFSI